MVKYKPVEWGTTAKSTIMKVYHRREYVGMDDDMIDGLGVTIDTFPKGYELVADIKADSLDHAFSITNNMSTPWVKGSAVIKAHKNGECRSTSAGDVVVVGSTPWLCCFIGWKQLPDMDE